MKSVNWKRLKNSSLLKKRNTVDEDSDALEKLNEMIGLSEVKASVRKFINLTKVNKEERTGTPGKAVITAFSLSGQSGYRKNDCCKTRRSGSLSGRRP
ncbi:hypothetical protein [Jeotgalicoccus sp. WY2]|uniref:hypothetical protein n=1 Tax=Jeotgalicoccus sp. WY2 TaxID=2708346 RepID=UPI002020FB37|nr:hypothetical protein [Jeotgalicoccus sp. WY2]